MLSVAIQRQQFGPGSIEWYQPPFTPPPPPPQYNVSPPPVLLSSQADQRGQMFVCWNIQ